MDLDRKAKEDLAKTVVWSQDSLGHARKHGQPKLIWLLEAVRVEVELDEALLALPPGHHPRLRTRDLLQERGGYG